MRSFQEHRDADLYEHRSVINEAAWFWRLLFLNNNYHLVHHDLPHVPWFALRKVYVASRVQYVQRSGGFLVKGYGEWARQYAVAVAMRPVHGELSRGAGFGAGAGAFDTFAGGLQARLRVASTTPVATREARVSASVGRDAPRHGRYGSRS
ncbi:hypothetical protein PPGU19_036550 [Paraburkholderia sp. PGU19]|nr:hypothetical protein PPGU19_036550 [Paraburkholderia sp. PGU19]